MNDEQIYPISVILGMLTALQLLRNYPPLISRFFLFIVHTNMCSWKWHTIFWQLIIINEVIIDTKNCYCCNNNMPIIYGIYCDVIFVSAIPGNIYCIFISGCFVNFCNFVFKVWNSNLEIGNGSNLQNQVLSLFIQEGPGCCSEEN